MLWRESIVDAAPTGGEHAGVAVAKHESVHVGERAVVEVGADIHPDMGGVRLRAETIGRGGTPFCVES